MKTSSPFTRRKFMSGTALGLIAAATPFDARLFAAESTRLLPLDSADHLHLRGCKAALTDHLGRRAVQLSDFPGNNPADSGMLAVIPEITFKDGMIEVESAGGPINGPTPGFLGLAFRIQDEMEKFEYVYLRPRNGRHENQLQRNHSCQYASHPGFGWKKLRDEFPGAYESYVDLEVDAWTKMKLDIRGAKLRLFINDAPQPCLVVNDLKLGDVSGAVALWIGPATRAYFRNLRITGL
jgi:hypothetical protein